MGLSICQYAGGVGFADFFFHFFMVLCFISLKKETVFNFQKILSDTTIPMSKMT